MLFATQRTLPFGSRSTYAAQTGGRTSGQTSGQTSGRSRSPATRTPFAGAQTPTILAKVRSHGSVSVPASTSFDVKSFAEKRLLHAVELAGACIMMATFLAVALFS